MKSKIQSAPVKSLRVTVAEITPEEHELRTRRGSQEIIKLMKTALTKILRITCEEYRDARVLAQRLTAARSFYGFEVTVQHRGKDIFLKPRTSNVELDHVTVDSDNDVVTKSKGKK